MFQCSYTLSEMTVKHVISMLTRLGNMREKKAVEKGLNCVLDCPVHRYVVRKPQRENVSSFNQSVRGCD